MEVIELFTQGKFPAHPSEDVVVATDAFAAVIDGASTAATFSHTTDDPPGRLAALAIAEAVRRLPAEADAYVAVSLMTQAVAALRGAQDAASADADFNDRPNASFVLYAAARREVWQVGDCQFLTVDAEGRTQLHTNEKLIDLVMAEWRCAVDRSLLARGVMTETQLRADDRGRQMIDPFIARQIRYQNLDSEHRLAYGVIDGTPLPRRFVRVHRLAPAVRELILASDGYPQLLPTLAESEAALSGLLAADPLCLHAPMTGTKGIKLEAVCHDDRSYLRLRIASGAPRLRL